MKIPSNIYKFTNYRNFLKDRYRQLKSADPDFSFRHFSKHAGFGSPNYLKLVMDGKRNLSEIGADKFAIGLRLDNHETEYFKYMVEANQCKEETKKKVFEAKLLYLKELFNVKHLIPELYDYYHEWHHAALFELIKTKKPINDPKILAESLVPSITEDEARLSIELLKQLNLVQVTNNNHLIAQESGEGKSNLDKTKVAAQKIHYEKMAELAARSLYTQGPETQDFESVTLVLDANKITTLREKIKDLMDFIKNAQQTNVENNGLVFQLNIQLFAIAAMNKKFEKEEHHFELL